MDTHSGRYKQEIDGLRAIAVLSVVLFHLNASILPGGFMGVDVFFVISGYLITNIIRKDLDTQSFTFSGFYIKRIIRIIPALYVLLLVTSVAAVVFLLPSDLKDYGRSLLSQSVFASNFYFYLKSSYFDTPSLLKPLLHTWSLSAEEQFYIIYPALLFFLTKLFKQGVKYVILLLFLTGLFTCHHIYLSDQDAAFFLLPTKIWELLLGALLTYKFVTVKPLSKLFLNAISSTGIIFIFFAFVFFSKNTSFYGLYALLPAMGTALIIFAGDITLAGKLLSISLLNFTGKISYSLYLWHWPVIVFYLYITGNNITFTVGFVLFVLSYLLASFSYWCIETPVRKSPSPIRYKWYLILTFLGSAIFGTTGFYFNKTDGLPKRFSYHIQQMLKNAKPLGGCVVSVIKKDEQPINFINSCNTNSFNTKPAILVWGDSHSRMLQPVLQQLADSYHQQFAFYNCPSALNVYLANWSASYPESPCYQSNKEIIKFINDHHIKCVLFASAWSQYTEGREVKMEGAGQKDKLYADPATNTPSLNDAKRVFKSHINYTVDLLTGLNVDVWIMEQVPQYQFWVPNEIARHIIYNQDTTMIGSKLENHLQRQSFVNSVFKTLTKNKRVHLLDPVPYFLKGRHFLTVYKNGLSLYFDYNHLSPYGTLLLKPMFRPLFDSLSRNNVAKYVK